MLQLREHQQAVVDRLNQNFAEGHRCQLLYAPTGFGKTETAMAIMKEVSAGYKRVAMIVDRIVLVDQTSDRLSKYGIEHGVMQSGHWRYRPAERIQICSAQTLEKRKAFPDIDMLIVDECHVQRRGTTKFIKDNPNIKVIGLTATPFTSGLGNTYTHVVGASSTGDLIENGWLCPLKVFIAKEIDMTGAKKVAGEWSQGEASERGIKIIGDVVSEWVKKTHEIFDKPEKTIVFCAGVDHGRALAEEFCRAGYNFVSISYKEDDQFKKDTVEEFAKPDSRIVGLIATDILTRGFDVPDVKIGVSARPFSKSFSSHVQQLGRVMRPHASKEFGIWLDHSGNYLRFRDDWDMLYAEGVKELSEEGEKAKRELTTREKEKAKCPACNALWVGASNVCSSCGFTKMRTKHVISIFGALEELETKRGKKNNGKSQQDFYSEVLYYGRKNNMQDGWAYHMAKEKYGGVFQKSIKPVTKVPSEETLKWIKYKMLRIAKGYQKSQKKAGIIK